MFLGSIAGTLAGSATMVWHREASNSHASRGISGEKKCLVAPNCLSPKTNSGLAILELQKTSNSWTHLPRCLIHSHTPITKHPLFKGNNYWIISLLNQILIRRNLLATTTTHTNVMLVLEMLKCTLERYTRLPACSVIHSFAQLTIFLSKKGVILTFIYGYPTIL